MPPATPPSNGTGDDDAKVPKRKLLRQPVPTELLRVERIIDLPEDEKACMDADWVFIGYDTSEQLALIARQRYVIVYKRAKYARHEAVPGAGIGVKIAPRPAQIIPKVIAHSALLTAIVTGNFVDGLPLY